jgi:hypothetical protein
MVFVWVPVTALLLLLLLLLKNTFVARTIKIRRGRRISGLNETRTILLMLMLLLLLQRRKHSHGTKPLPDTAAMAIARDMPAG